VEFLKSSNFKDRIEAKALEGMKANMKSWITIVRKQGLLKRNEHVISKSEVLSKSPPI